MLFVEEESKKKCFVSKGVSRSITFLLLFSRGICSSEPGMGLFVSVCSGIAQGLSEAWHSDRMVETEGQDQDLGHVKQIPGEGEV